HRYRLDKVSFTCPLPTTTTANCWQWLHCDEQCRAHCRRLRVFTLLFRAGHCSPDLPPSLSRPNVDSQGPFDLGFSWVEVGSVTPSPQPGNPRPRFFHLPEDSAVIDRYGFPSQGTMSVLNRIRARLPTFLQEDNDTASFRSGSVLAVDLGKNKSSPADSIQDFVDGVRMFGSYSDVLVANVSSPTTPGLCGLQGRDTLQTLLEGVTKARDDLPPSTVTSAPKPKLVLKIAPDLNEPQLIEAAEVIRNSHIDGVIVSNTTISRPLSRHHRQ
ncbi:Dihydroorotate dehydrogenase-domain-containing protein, partial [Armillaria mellea]